jgi:hypothetical protein
LAHFDAEPEYSLGQYPAAAGDERLPHVARCKSANQQLRLALTAAKPASRVHVNDLRGHQRKDRGDSGAAA